TGFIETASLPGLMGPHGEGQIAILARKAYQPHPAAERVMERPAEKSWLIFADEGGVGSALIERLRATRVRCRIARRGTEFATTGGDAFTLRAEAPDDWHQLFAAFNGAAQPERIVYLWNLDTQRDESAVFGTDALLHLVQGLETRWPAAKLRIDSITRGAQA